MYTRRSSVIIAAAVVLIFVLYLFIRIHALLKEGVPVAAPEPAEQAARVSNQPVIDYALPNNVAPIQDTAEAIKSANDENMAVKMTDDKIKTARQQRRAEAMQAALQAEKASAENTQQISKEKPAPPQKKTVVFPTREVRDSWKAKGILAY